MKKFILNVFILFVAFFFMQNLCLASQNTEAILQYNRGIDYYKIGQYDDAIVSFRNAIKADPNYIDAYYNLGAVLEYLEQYDAALTIFKQIIVRKPDDYESVYKAAWLSHKLGENQKAKTYLALIPAYSSQAKNAQYLAQQLNFSLNKTPQTQAQSPSDSTKIPQTNNLYSNIPTPTGITSDKDGNIYVAQYNTNSIIKITTDNKKLVYMKSPKINGPIGIVMDKSNNLYVANYNTDNVLKISPSGEVSILISNVKKPYYMYLVENILFVSCQGSNSVLKYKL